MGEIWKSIAGYEGLYEVSNLGAVRSLDRKVINVLTKGFSVSKGQKLAPWLSRGYLRVGLSKNSKHKYFSVHVLVAKAFIQNEYNKPHVNHIDGDKYNNSASNLEWVTVKENIAHAIHVLQRNCHNMWIFNTLTGIYYHTIKDSVKYSGITYSAQKVGRMLSGKEVNKTSLVKT